MRLDRHTEEPPRVFALLLYWLALVSLLGVIGRCADEPAHASEGSPPIILPVPRATHERWFLHPSTEARPHASPADGPMCMEPLLVGEEEISEVERKAVERQIAACSRKPGRHADVWGLLALLRLEEQFGVPAEAHGILGAIVCIESAARQGVHRGDWRDGVARAHGPLQLHGWAEPVCGLRVGGRDDLEAGARCYWSRVEARAATVAHCADRWRVAEALVANAPRYSRWRCRAASAHWREMEAWR